MRQHDPTVPKITFRDIRSFQGIHWIPDIMTYYHMYSPTIYIILLIAQKSEINNRNFPSALRSDFINKFIHKENGEPPVCTNWCNRWRRNSIRIVTLMINKWCMFCQLLTAAKRNHCEDPRFPDFSSAKQRISLSARWSEQRSATCDMVAWIVATSWPPSKEHCLELH